MLPVPAWKMHQKCSGLVGLLWASHHRGEEALQDDRTASGRLFWHTEASSQSHSSFRAWGNIEQRRRKCEKTELMHYYTSASVKEKVINLYVAPFLFGFADHVFCSRTTIAAACCLSQWEIKRQADLPVNKIDFNFNLINITWFNKIRRDYFGIYDNVLGI